MFNQPKLYDDWFLKENFCLPFFKSHRFLSRYVIFFPSLKMKTTTCLLCAISFDIIIFFFVFHVLFITCIRFRSKHRSVSICTQVMNSFIHHHQHPGNLFRTIYWTNIIKHTRANIYIYPKRYRNEEEENIVYYSAKDGYVCVTYSQ